MASVIKPTNAQIKSWVKGSTIYRKKYSSGIVIEQMDVEKEVEYVLEWMYDNHYQLIGVQPHGTHERSHRATAVATPCADSFKEFNIE